jgi:hypothetical protein
MEIPVNVAIQFHELIVLLLSAFVLFIVGTYLSERIKAGVNKKATVHGSAEVCGSCPALSESKKISVIEGKQEQIRGPEGVLAKLDRSVTTLTNSTMSLETRVTKLFTLIEGDWQEQIRSLKTKLEEKDQQIRRLENKG